MSVLALSPRRFRNAGLESRDCTAVTISLTSNEVNTPALPFLITSATEPTFVETVGTPAMPA